ncbi:hypothetical protein [Bradyrhizobium iriomotense]|uniref:hypothetical protein n=1 Tax=Bradyrhizobium iriomotense TaxID=441950 RepID=UPI001B8A767D|nr:hypothetical protein [Bradyrhizobium iriomotense]MBR1131004.1 hypothetical protein [Bradyrhizobium iriomotense]
MFFKMLAGRFCRVSGNNCRLRDHLAPQPCNHHIVSRHGGSSILNRCRGEKTLTLRGTRRSNATRAQRMKTRLFPSVNEGETTFALGNFFRITFFEPSDFFESVSRGECDFESRVNFFRACGA